MARPVFASTSDLPLTSGQPWTTFWSSAATELVSGSATARALYWEDGSAVYYPGSGLPLVTARKDLERKASAWLADKDFGGLAPLIASGTPTILAAAVGDADRALGWARNDELGPPDWRAPAVAGAAITVTLPAGAADGPWAVTLTMPDDGGTASVSGTSQGGVLSFSIAAPFDHAAFAASRSVP
jgi:hypothetical protein